MINPPVVALGEGVTLLGVLRAFAHNNITIYSTAGSADTSTRSRYFQRLPGLAELRQGLPATPQAITSALTASGLAEVVLVPCTDRFSAAVASLPEQTAATRIHRSMPVADTLALFNDKGRFAELLQTTGVAHPRTQLLSGANDLDATRFASGGELFLKPRDSQNFFSRFGVKAFRVTSLADARTRLAEIQTHGLQMVLQDYVPGPSDNHYFVDGFRDRDGVVRATFARRRLRIYPPDFGNSTAMISVAPETMAKPIAGLQRLLEHTNYRGIFSAEFKLDARDGEYRILEVNTRPWWFIDFAVRSGVDVCAMVYADALQRPVSTVDSYDVGATCIFPYYDLFAIRNLHAAGGKYSWTRWLSDLTRARQPIFLWRDPLPAIVGASRILTQAISGASRKSRR